MTGNSNNPWNLVADIGGTNARFAIHDNASGALSAVTRYTVSAFPEFNQALEQFLGEVAQSGGSCPLPAATCIAVACPPDTDIVQFTNSPWTIDPRQLAARLELPRVDIINDFAAVGYAVTELVPADWHGLGGSEAVDGAPMVVLGPGTGLGVCSLVASGTDYQVIEGEGGHVDFAPVDAQQLAIFNILRERFGRVSIERLLSGAGIVNIYQAQSQLDDLPPAYDTPAEITAAALQGGCAVARQALEIFCNLLGAVAGDLALTLGARGGVYVAGGIVPRLIDFLENSQFRQRFEAKGRFRDYLASIPLRVIVKENLGLHGAARKIQLAQL